MPDAGPRQVLQDGVGRRVIADPTDDLDRRRPASAAAMATRAGMPSATTRPASRRATGEPTTTITR